MSTVKKASNPKSNHKAVISTEVRDHSNDPFVLKKVAEAKETLSKTDLSILLKK
ncbi:MAG TPA: hypothetical protein VGN20_15810 [Mucilaginibacter sp.]|jgi:hypothetical protein